MSKLKVLLAQPDNRICADCGAPDPKWASTNIGVFVCIKCSGVHRSLGVHISKVLSVTLDEWTEEQVEVMDAVGGNAAANAVYEAAIPRGMHKPGAEASVEERSDWIKRKYEDQEFLKPTLRMKTKTHSQSSALQTNDSNVSLGQSQKSGASVGHSRNSHASPGQSQKSSASTRQSHKCDASLAHSNQSSLSTAGMVEFLGLLKVRVMRGIDLAVRDYISSDPYVVVNLGQQTLKTRIIKRNLNPVWNEELMFSVPSPPQPLKLQVYDYDMLSSDDIMGDAEVDLNPLIVAAQMHQEMIESVGTEQIGRWLATSDNALVKDSSIEAVDGVIKQDILLKLQNVEKGVLEVSLEWAPLSQ